MYGLVAPKPSSQTADTETSISAGIIISGYNPIFVSGRISIEAELQPSRERDQGWKTVRGGKLGGRKRFAAALPQFQFAPAPTYWGHMPFCPPVEAMHAVTVKLKAIDLQ